MMAGLHRIENGQPLLGKLTIWCKLCMSFAEAASRSHRHFQALSPPAGHCQSRTKPA